MAVASSLLAANNYVLDGKVINTATAPREGLGLLAAPGVPGAEAPANFAQRVLPQTTTPAPNPPAPAMLAAAVKLTVVAGENLTVGGPS